jgi:hypothetical protein
MTYTTGQFTVDETGFIQIAQSRVLSAVTRGEIDLNLLAREELAARGQDENGIGVGFDRARSLLVKAKQDGSFQATENLTRKLTQAEMAQDKALFDLEDALRQRDHLLLHQNSVQ